jgi:hypothetical protein
MMLERMKELFGIAHVRDNEEEVTNAKCMRIGEEDVSLSQPITAVVPPVVVLEVEEEVPTSLSRSRQKERDASLSWSMTRASMMKDLYRPW